MQVNQIQMVAKEPLYMKIADAILNFIKENHLKAGERLPSERALAEQCVTSRNSVREALRVLEQEGIVEVKTGKGVFVARDTEKEFIHMTLWEKNFTEILEVKYFLERGIVENLCRTVTGEQLMSFEEPLLKMEASAEDSVYLQAEDFLFHQRIRELCSNSTLRQIVDQLAHTLADYGMAISGTTPYWLATIPAHRELLEGLRERNPVRAGKACKEIFELDLEVLQKEE